MGSYNEVITKKGNKNIKFNKGNIKKVIAGILVISIVGGTLCKIGTKNNIVKASEHNEQNINIDDKELEGMEEASIIDSLEVANCIVKDMEEEVSEVISYKVDGSRSISKISTTKIDKLYYNSNDELVYTETIDFNETQDAINKNQSNNSRGTGIKVYEVFNFKHWYQMAINDKTLKIGCDAAYEIGYSKLNSSEKAVCDAYTSAVNSSNGCVAAAIAIVIIVSAGTASGIAVTVLDLASQGLTKEVIASFILKKFAKHITKKTVAVKIVEGISSAISFSAFKSARSDVKKYYKIAKTYGKKI